MNIGIVDDERPARSELKYMLKLKLPDANILEAKSSEEMLELLKKQELDVVFVDIQLGDMNGTTLASLILEKQPDIAIVFATAYEEYAVNAYELGAIDYLLKPFSLDRIEKCINRIFEFTDLKNRNCDNNPTLNKRNTKVNTKVNSNKCEVNNIIVENSNMDNKEKLTLVLSESIKIISIKEIVYFQSYNRGCNIYTKDNMYYQNKTLNYYDEKLTNCCFFRVHKSFLVNLNYIEEMIPHYNNGYAIRLKEIKEEMIPVGRSQYRELRDYFDI